MLGNPSSYKFSRINFIPEIYTQKHNMLKRILFYCSHCSGWGEAVGQRKDADVMDRTGLHLELWRLRRMEECVGGSQNGESGWENNEIALWVHACLHDLHTDWCKSEWPQGPWGGGETKASVSLLTTGLGADTYLLVKMTTRYCRNMIFSLFFWSLFTDYKTRTWCDQWSNQMQ